MIRISRVVLTAVICMTALIGSQSVYALTEAAKAAAAAAADSAKINGVMGQEAANDIAGAAYGASDASEENLGSSIACLVSEESGRAGVEGVTPENAARAAAIATSAPEGSIIYVCDPTVAYKVTTTTTVDGRVIAGVIAAAGLVAVVAASSDGDDDDDKPTSP